MSVNSDYCKMSPLPDEVKKLQQLNDKLLLTSNESDNWRPDNTSISNPYSPWNLGFATDFSNQTAGQRLNNTNMDTAFNNLDEEDRIAPFGNIGSSCDGSSNTAITSVTSPTGTTTTTNSTGIGVVQSVTDTAPCLPNPLDYSIHSQLCDSRFNPNSSSNSSFNRTLPGHLSGLSSPNSSVPSHTFNTLDQKSFRPNRPTQESNYLKRKLNVTNTTSSVGKRANVNSGRHSKLTSNTPMMNHEMTVPFQTSDRDVTKSPVHSPNSLQPPHLKPHLETMPNLTSPLPGRRRQKLDKETADFKSDGSLPTKSPANMHKISNSKRHNNAQMNSTNGDFTNTTSTTITTMSGSSSSSGTATTTTTTDGTNNTSGSATNKSNVPTAAYKYLTWREKDRRRRFREEWKHLWLVIPHGRYEVMCLVCHKVMTQRKLDTIKRHTVRRHVELLGMPESERQDLFDQLMKQHNLISNSNPGSPPALPVKFSRKSSDTYKTGSTKYSRIPQRTPSNVPMDGIPPRYPFGSPSWFAENIDTATANQASPNRLPNSMNPFLSGKLGLGVGPDQFPNPNHHGNPKLTDRTSHINSNFTSTFPTTNPIDRRLNTETNSLEDLQSRVPASSGYPNYPESSLLNSRSSSLSSKNHTPVIPMVSTPSSPILSVPYPPANLLHGPLESHSFRQLFKQFASSTMKQPGSNNFPLADMNLKNPMDLFPKLLSPNRFATALDPNPAEIKMGSNPHTSFNLNGTKYGVNTTSVASAGVKADSVNCINKVSHNSISQPEFNPMLTNLSSALTGFNQNWLSKFTELQNLKTPLNTESFPLMMASWAAAIAASSKYCTNNSPTNPNTQIPKDDIMNQSPTASLSSTQSACSWNSERSPLRSLPSSHHPEQTLTTSNPSETGIKQMNVPPVSPPLKGKLPTNYDTIESYRNATPLNGLLPTFHTNLKPDGNKPVCDENKFSFTNFWAINNNEPNPTNTLRNRPPESKQQPKFPECCNSLGHYSFNSPKLWNPDNLPESLTCLLCNWENRKESSQLNSTTTFSSGNCNSSLNSLPQLGLNPNLGQTKVNREKVNLSPEDDLKVAVTQPDTIFPSPTEPSKIPSVSEAYRLYSDVLASIYNQRKQALWNNSSGTAQPSEQLNLESYMTLYYAEVLRHQYESLKGSTNLNTPSQLHMHPTVSLGSTGSVLDSGQTSPEHQRNSRSSTPKKSHKTRKTSTESGTKINCQYSTEVDQEKKINGQTMHCKSPLGLTAKLHQSGTFDQPVSEWSQSTESDKPSELKHLHNRPTNASSLSCSNPEITTDLPSRLSPLWWASVSTPLCSQTTDSGNETSASNPTSGASLRVHLLRLGPGQDLYQSLSHYVLKQRFAGAFVITCCGSVRGVNLRTANLQKKYFEGPLEVVSLVGTISNDGYPHLHIALADSNGVVIGGHLLDQTLVHTTIEMVLGVTGIEPDSNDCSGDVDVCDTSSPQTLDNENCLKKTTTSSTGLRLVRKFSNSTGFRELMVEDMIN